MKKSTCLLFLVLCLLVACSKPDPILPGDRAPIFPNTELVIANKEITNPQSEVAGPQSDCPYTRDGANIVWDGERKIFSGFATGNAVDTSFAPVCAGGFVYAGLSTGELVKVNPKTRAIAWIADIYRASNVTGGAKLTDIVAPAVISGNFVYTGGLGDAFCKLRNASGAKVWCHNIGVGVPFLMTQNFAFVVATDGNMYAINTSNGEIYWKTQIEAQAAPKLDHDIIMVGDEKFEVKNGAPVSV